MENMRHESGRASQPSKKAILALVVGLAACGPRDVVAPEEVEAADLPEDCSDYTESNVTVEGPTIAMIQCDASQAAGDALQAAPSCGSLIVDGDGDTGVLRTHFSTGSFRVCEGPVIVETIAHFADGSEADLKGEQKLDRPAKLSSVDARLRPGMTSFQLEARNRFGKRARTQPPTRFR